MSEGYFHMGGYAFYVWTSFGLAAVIYAWNSIAPRLARREIEKKLVEDA